MAEREWHRREGKSRIKPLLVIVYVVVAAGAVVGLLQLLGRL